MHALRTDHVSAEEGGQSLEMLDLSGITLMQLYSIGVSTIPELKAHTTETLRVKLVATLEGKKVNERVEKTLTDIQQAVKIHPQRPSNTAETSTSAQMGKLLPIPKPEPEEVRAVDEPEELYQRVDTANSHAPQYQNDTLAGLYADIRKYKILTRAQQAELSLRIQKDTGDIEARNLLVLHNMRLSLWIARKYLWHTAKKADSSGFEYADLVQEGMVGLITAAERYDHTLSAFSTYAHWWIRQSISRALQDGGFIRIPVNLLEIVSKVRSSMNKLAAHHGRPPTLTEIAIATGLSSSKVKQAIRVAQLSFVSTDEVLPSVEQTDSVSTRGEYIPDNSKLDAEQMLMARQELDAACGRLNELTEWLYADDAITEKNREIFVKLYGLDGALQKRTSEHVGEIFGVTRQRIDTALKECWVKLQRNGVDMDHESVIEELWRIGELESLAGKLVSSV